MTTANGNLTNTTLYKIRGNKMPKSKSALLNEISNTIDKMLEDSDCNLPFNELDLESAHLAALHNHLDRFCLVETDESAWARFGTLEEIISYYLDAMNDKDIKKRYSQIVNMPQMALTGLSESWLFKEMGDCHWHMLCENLGLKSNAILDEFRNRLYATFIRIRYESTSSLKHYQENDHIDIIGRIQRFGNSLYFGQVELASDEKIIRCSLATTFSTRDSSCDNHKLTKGVPSGSEENVVTKMSDMPKLVLDYIKLKKRTIQTVELGDHSFAVTDDSLFAVTYKLNPYTDINGVGLLYFAAYPLINDYCELEYFNNERASGKHWALTSATVMRDVFYFANCNIEDVITYQLNSFQMIANNRVAIQSSLLRESDNTVMARIFTIKQVES
jgi:probable biosynthetic protein (TIGR04098 family)